MMRSFTIIAMAAVILITAVRAQDKPKPTDPDSPLAVLMAKHATLLRCDNDKVIKKEFVPSKKKPQGEIRLIQRGKRKLLQNLLYTKFLKRATGVIRKKEETVWKEGMPGYEDSRKYVDAMVAARDFIWQRFKARKDKTDRRQKMMVELISGDKGGIVVFYEIEIAETGKEVTIQKRRPFYIMPVSNEYLLRDTRFICKDALKLTDEDINEAFPVKPKEAPEKH